MRRASALLHRERGQTLVWVAGGLTVLMIMLAFAIDIGTLQGERRHMQNAADAAALEAARARCFDPGVTTGVQAAALGQQFAENNYSSRPFAATETFTVTARTNNDWEFDAYATEMVNLSFAGIFTGGQVAVTTQAAAACGGSPYACGLFPLAFSMDLWNSIKDQCGQTFYVWTSDQDLPGVIPPDCTRCNCDTVYTHPQATPIAGAKAVADVGRAWLDFTSASSALNPVDCGASNGCGASELTCWIKNDSQVLALKDTCVSGTNGVKFGTHTAINERKGQFITVPLFDRRCETGRGTGDCDNEGFNITSFGCVQIVGILPSEKVQLAWRSTPTPYPGWEADRWCFTDQMLQVKIGCGQCETTCGKAPEGGNPGSGIKAVSLID